MEEKEDDPQWEKVVAMAKFISIIRGVSPERALKEAQQFWDYVHSIEKVTESLCAGNE